MYGIDAGMGGKMRSIATMKAKKKKSKTSKIGDMLDRKEMEQAPRRPSVTKAKPKKAISKMDERMGKITTLEIKPGMRGTDPRLMRRKNK